MLNTESVFRTFVVESLQKYLSHNAYIIIDVFEAALVNIYTLACPTKKNKLAMLYTQQPYLNGLSRLAVLLHDITRINTFTKSCAAYYPSTMQLRLKTKA